MPHRKTAALVLALLGLGSGLLGCGPSREQQRAAAEREREQRLALAELQRCRRNQVAVTQLTAEIQRDTAELARVNGERYEPAPRPEPPDPVLAARFTQDDRELDELRYRDQLRNWEASEQQRYGHWLDEQDARRSRLRAQVESAASRLRRLAPELMAAAAGSSLKPEAVSRAVRCNPADFGLQNSAVAGSSSKAAAN